MIRSALRLSTSYACPLWISICKNLSKIMGKWTASCTSLRQKASSLPLSTSLNRRMRASWQPAIAWNWGRSRGTSHSLKWWNRRQQLLMSTKRSANSLKCNSSTMTSQRWPRCLWERYGVQNRRWAVTLMQIIALWELLQTKSRQCEEIWSPTCSNLFAQTMTGHGSANRSAKDNSKKNTWNKRLR